MIVGAVLYQIMVFAFACVFRRYVWAFHSYQYLNKLKAESAAKSLEERNEICRKATEFNCRYMGFMKQQMR